jgi:nitrite reductase/ring-hydroxylating ferredoxin subunit/uncharacterized membrane protein
MGTPLAKLAEGIEEFKGLDPLARTVGEVGERLIPLGPVKDLLSGTWMGHALHPALTDLVVGSWTSAFVLDVVGGEQARDGADWLIGVGVLSALPTAATGLSDWIDTTGRERRMGMVHAVGNVAALAMYATSFVLRRRGRRGSGFALSVLGAATASFTAYLGGHLVFDRSVGVNQTATEQRPRRWTKAIDSSELPDGTPVLARPGGEAVVLYRRGTEIMVLADRCSHRGGPLHDGEVDRWACTVTCPWHGSVFDLRSGEIKRGPASSPQPTYEARESGGVVEVRSRS